MVNAGAAFFLACSMASQSGSPDGLLQSQDQKIMNEHLNNFYRTNNEIVFETKDELELIKENVLSDKYVLFFDINDDGELDSTDLMSALNIYLKNQPESVKEPEPEPVKEIKSEPVAVVTEAPVQSEPPAQTQPPQETQPQPEPVKYTEVPGALYSGDPSIDDSDITAYGIDVSAFQGRIDWEKVRNSGKTFAIIKAGEGLRVADRFEENIRNAKAAGMNVGVYWFCHARSVQEAKEEADYCLKTIAGYQLEYPVVCDYEYSALKNGNPLAYDRQGMTDTVMAFMKRTQDNGYYSMLYTNTDFSSNYLDMSRITKDFDIWFAGYSVSAPTMKCGMWQYSESGYVDGLDLDNNGIKQVDLDVSYKNYPAKMKKYHVNGY